MNVLILCITSVISVNIEYHYSHCMESTQLLPQTLKMAIGYYNNTIFLLGGHGYVRQITKLDTLAGNYYYNSTAMVPESTWGIWGLSQYYAQWNERLYWIDPQSGATTVNNKIYVYNLRSGNYIDNTSIVSPKKVRVGGCLATNGDLLFVTGGRTTSQGSNQNTVKIYNISSALWLSNIPLMQKARQTHACVWNKVTNELYAIGGYTDTVERIMIHNITNQNWEYTIDTLLYPTNGGTAISIYDSILLIGGTDTNTNNRSMVIQIINCLTGQVSADEKLIYGVMNPSLLIVNTTLYVFGGHDGGINDSRQTWQYFNLLTNAPTYAPTGEPTMDPTVYPTFNPTVNPTTNPNAAPVRSPTHGSEGLVTDMFSTEPITDENVMYGNVERSNTVMIIIIVTGALLILCLVIILVICIKKSKHKNHNDSKAIEIGMGQHVNIIGNDINNVLSVSSGASDNDYINVDNETQLTPRIPPIVTEYGDTHGISDNNTMKGEYVHDEGHNDDDEIVIEVNRTKGMIGKTDDDIVDQINSEINKTTTGTTLNGNDIGIIDDNGVTMGQ
eukprot:523147_1